jgi:hypothetical protein
MKFGASTFIWVSPFSNTTLDLAEKVRDMGFDILERQSIRKAFSKDWSLPGLKRLFVALLGRIATRVRRIQRYAAKRWNT